MGTLLPRINQLVQRLILGVGLPLLSNSAEIISSIEVNGNKRFLAETIILKSGIHPGDDLQKVNLTLASEKLWNTGWFENIIFLVDQNKISSQNILIIEVTENPIITEVVYRGGRKIGLENIKKSITTSKLVIKNNSIFNEQMATDIKNNIIDKCKMSGFIDPKISLKLEPTKEGIARLIFDINEGNKLHIYNIEFRGTDAFKGRKISSLLKAMKKVKKYWLFSFLSKDDLLVEKKIEDDLINIKNTYLSNGYKDVIIDKPVINIEDYTTQNQKNRNIDLIKNGKPPKFDLRAKVIISVREGEQYHEGALTVSGNEKLFIGDKGRKILQKIFMDAKGKKSFLHKIFNYEKITNGTPKTKNNIINLKSIDKGIEIIRDTYANNGFIKVAIGKKSNFFEKNGEKKIDTIININEGEKYSIRRIDFEGNIKTKDKILRRALRIRETDPFLIDKYKSSFAGIGQLGFFKVDDVKVELDKVKSVVDIKVTGKEAVLNDIIFQAGYNHIQRFIFGINLTTRNLLGNGETLGLNFNYSKYQRNTSLNFKIPYFLDRPYSLSASVLDQSEKFDGSRVGSDYASYIKAKGLYLGSDVNLASVFHGALIDWIKWTRYGIGYTLKKNKIEGNPSASFLTSLPQLSSAIHQNIIYSTINHPFSPTEGLKLGFNLDFGGWQFGNEKFYFKYGVELAKLASPIKGHVFGFKVKFNQIANLNKENLPIWLMYRPGGENSIRGYRPSSVGSILFDANNIPLAVGGNRQLISNFEYQFKVIDQIQMVFFFDAGNAWLPGEKIFNHNLVSYKFNNLEQVEYRNPSLVKSLGVEMRIFLPISPAPLRFIWAKKLNPYPHDLDGKTQFQFSIGSNF